MFATRLLPAALLLSSLAVAAQQPGQPALTIQPNNRTLSVSADDEVSVEPEIAVLHIGFDTQLGDAQSVYADGARTSNAIGLIMAPTGNFPAGYFLPSTLLARCQHLCINSMRISSASILHRRATSEASVL